MIKRSIARYTLNPAQISLFPVNPEVATRQVATHSDLPKSPTTGVGVEYEKEGETPNVWDKEGPLLQSIPTLYCAPCGGRGSNYQNSDTGLGGIDEVPCLHCEGKGLLSQGCNPNRKKVISPHGQRLMAEESNQVDSPHQWVFPSPLYATCLRCNLTALTRREPDPLELMTPKVTPNNPTPFQ